MVFWKMKNLFIGNVMWFLTVFGCKSKPKSEPNRYLVEECGEAAGTYIANGENAFPNQYPFVVLVGNHAAGEICGGFIISHIHILTAAHCVYGKPAYNFRNILKK